MTVGKYYLDYLHTSSEILRKVRQTATVARLQEVRVLK